MTDHGFEKQNNHQAGSSADQIAELLRQDIEPKYRTSTKKVTSKLDLTGIAESNFNELDLDGSGGISREELDKAVSVLTARGDKDAAKVAKTLRDNFNGLSADDQQLRMSDLASFRFKHDEIKKEETMLSDLQKGAADSAFKKIGGQLDSTVNYSQIEHALEADNLTSKDRDMLGYMLLNYNQVEALAKQNHPDQQGVTLADMKMFATQRLGGLPDASQMDEDMTKTTLVRQKIRVKPQPRRDSLDGVFEPGPKPETPRDLPPLNPKPLKAMGSIN